MDEAIDAEIVPAPLMENSSRDEEPEQVAGIKTATLTDTLRHIMDSPVEAIVPETDEHVLQQTSSVREVALRHGLTLEQYTAHHPDTAVKLAESCYAYWMSVLDQAAMDNVIHTTDGDIPVTRNQVNLIDRRLHIAKEELDAVNEYALTAQRIGEHNRDYLLRVAINKAVKHPGSRLMTYLIDRVDGKAPEATVQEYDYDYTFNVYCIIQTLFKEQLNVLNSGNGTKLICCSRRAGKTHLLVAIMLIECQRKSNTQCIYIGETAELSEMLIDSAANEIVDTCHLRDKHGKRFNWRKMDNGSRILVRGLSNTKDPDQIRGNKAKIIVIDEFFHLKSELLSYLKEEVLEPMQMDYADDYKFICAGTPPSIKNTYGEEAWRTWDCDKFQWTWRNNPHPVDPQQREEYVNKKLEEKGLDWSSAYARREYNGEWAYDDELLLYPEYYTFDVAEGCPKIHVDQVLIGLDYGVSDNDAIVAFAWDSSAKSGFQIYEAKFSRLDILDLKISQLEYLKSKVKAVWAIALDLFPGMSKREANKRILWDADDNDQHITDELNATVTLPVPVENVVAAADNSLAVEKPLRLNIQNAHKGDKVIMFDKIKEVLRKGDLLIMSGSKLEDECMKTVLQRGANGQVFPIVDDGIFHPDLLPAMRYALYNVLM